MRMVKNKILRLKINTLIVRYILTIKINYANNYITEDIEANAINICLKYLSYQQQNCAKILPTFEIC